MINGTEYSDITKEKKCICIKELCLMFVQIIISYVNIKKKKKKKKSISN